MKNYNKYLEYMKSLLDYGEVFNILVEKTAKYVLENEIKAMVLGISGGIDSTVAAAICHAVSSHTGIPLIGRSLPIISNKDEEIKIARLVGEAFCDDFKEVNLIDPYNAMIDTIYSVTGEAYPEWNSWKQTPIANGNIKARLRMIYLYNIASVKKGIVISTDNQTEYQLGFWTLHGDVGDFNPLFGLWKTEVYGLANYLINQWSSYGHLDFKTDQWVEDPEWEKRIDALDQSMALTPTDGLGITSSDLEQIGANTYEEVDDILEEFFAYQQFVNIDMSLPLKDRANEFIMNQEMLYTDIEIIKKVMERHVRSEFKRKNLPICIERSEYEI